MLSYSENCERQPCMASRCVKASPGAQISSQERRIGLRKACAQRGARPPSHAGELSAIEELAWRPVGTRRIENELSPIADDLGNQLGKFRDGDLLAAADIDVLLVRIVLEDEHAGIGE